MKNFLMGAVLCTALSNFAMDRDVPNAPSPQPIESVEAFQQQFKELIDSENILAFRCFLKEHFGDAQEYMSEDIIQLALQKRESISSDKANKIYLLLCNLNSSKNDQLGGMEKMWHHLDPREDCDINNQRPFSPIMPTKEFHDAHNALPAEESGALSINFFQQKTLLNIMLRDFIERQDLNNIISVVTFLTQDNDCNLEDIISEKTVRAACQKMNQEKTEQSEAIYEIVSATTDFDDTNATDTTARALENTIRDFRSAGPPYSPEAQSAFNSFNLLFCVENSNIDSLGYALQILRQEDKPSFGKNISSELLDAARTMQEKYAAAHLLLGHEGQEKFNNAQCIIQRLHEANQEDEERVASRLKDALSPAVLESIVGPEREKCITALLEKE